MSMLPRVEQRGLKTTLTESERREKAMHAADRMEDARKLELEAERLKSEVKEKLENAKFMQGEARAQLSIMKQGWEIRQVDVRIEWADDKKNVEEMRTDTGEVIATRPPTPAEQQFSLPAIAKIDGKKGRA